MEITREEFREMLDKSEEKSKVEIKDLLESAIENSFQKFENNLLRRDVEVMQKINENERKIDMQKHDVTQVMSRTDKLFSIADEQRDDIADLKKMQADLGIIKNNCCERKNTTKDLVVAAQGLKNKVMYTQGFIGCLVVIFIIIKALM